jgi:hypothetical protein
LQVAYQSMVTWQDEVDYLRCNKSFFGHPRFDYVIFTTERGLSYAQLLRLFKLQVESHIYSLALVKVYGRPPGSLRRKDKDLGLHRVQLKSDPYQIIAIDSIVRGVVLAEDPDITGNYFVVDTIDGDIFLRMGNYL